MPTKFLINGNALIPAPFINLTKDFIRSEDQTIINSIWKIQIIGQIVSFMGSPSSSGTFWNLPGYPLNENISVDQMLTVNIRKQEALRQLFSKQNDGCLLEIFGADGLAPMEMNIRFGELTFSDSLWLNTVQYTLNAEADNISINGITNSEDVYPNYISSASESWDIETDESSPEGVHLPRTYRLSHNISAKGVRHFDVTGTLTMEAWKQARNFVISRVGLDSSILNNSSVSNLSSYMALNHVKNESINELAGDYSLSENWILSSGIAFEDFTVESRRSLESALTEVSINGQIQGLESRDLNDVVTAYKYDNSLAKFNSVSGNLLSRAQLYAGVNLNIIPISTSVGKNPVTGVISYNFGYNNRPSNLIPNTRSENIVIQDNLPTDVIAIVPILARSNGPILQNMQTSRERTRTLNIELVMDTTSYSGIVGMLTADPFLNPVTAPIISGIIATANPSVSYGANVSYLTDSNKSWEPYTGRANLTQIWTFEI